MILRRRIGVRSYFAKMVLWMSAAILLIVLVLSLVVYMNSQRLLIKNEYAANQKVLYQIQFNINLMNQTIGNLSKFLYVNSDVTKIMYAKKEDMEDVSVRLNTMIRSVVTANPYIHSISIYNHSLDEFYNVGTSLFFEDPLVGEFYRSGQELPVSKPVIRTIQKLVNGKEVPVQLFSYFIYEPTPEGKKPDGVVVVNVQPEWLINNLKQINAIDQKQGALVFILNDKGQFLENNSGNRDLKTWIKEQYASFEQSHPDSHLEGFFQQEFKKTKYLITYSNVDGVDLTLLKAQPVSEVYQSIDRLKTSILLITLIFLAFALLLSFSTSQLIYKPFGKLVKSIRSDPGLDSDEVEQEDEIGFLGSVYRQSMERLEHFNLEKLRYHNVMKSYWLNRLIVEGDVLEHAELERTFEEMRIALPLEGPYVILTLKIDRYREFQQTFTSRDQETIRFAIINIASEVISNHFPAEGLDMKGDHVVLIVRVSGEETLYSQLLDTCLREVNHIVSGYFKVMFSSSISDAAESLQALLKLYDQSLDLAIYRFVKGHSCIITSGNIAKNIDNKQAGYSRSLEEQFLQAVRTGDSTVLEESLSTIFGEISALSYHQAVVSIIRLVDAIKETLEASPGSLTIEELPTINRQILEKETIFEIRDLILTSLHDALANKNAIEGNAQNHYVVDAIKAFIYQNYSDSELSLTSTASKMKVSVRLLSKIFREATDTTIPNYINEIRLIKAAELLASQQMSVNEVIEKVGITNETYFFSLFKKKYGITPKEYALQKKVRRLALPELEEDGQR